VIDLYTRFAAVELIVVAILRAPLLAGAAGTNVHASRSKRKRSAIASISFSAPICPNDLWWRPN